MGLEGVLKEGKTQKCYSMNAQRLIKFYSFDAEQLLNMISGFRRDVDEICGILGNYPEDHRFQLLNIPAA
jgi:hypothetical protein